MKRLTAKENSYTRAVVLNGGDKVKAYETAGYSMNMNMVKIGIQADKVHNRPSVNLRIVELQKQANIVANKVFTISVKQRLEWLDDIREAGMETYKDQAGNERRESLTASNAAIKTMNEMLGTDEQGDGVKPVKVMIGVKDASRS